MQTRRDQLQAYRFQNRRALAALVTGEPNLLDPPMRRLTITTISGIMIAVLVTVGFTLFGLIRPKAGDSWKEAGAVIFEKQTGATFVYLGGVLHPVVNYTSAVLAVSSGGKQAETVEVDRDDIASAKRGDTLGILGLPSSLPPSDKLVTGPIGVCSRESVDTAGGDDISVRVTVHVDDLPDARNLAADDGILVNTGSGTQSYLLYDGLRLAVSSGPTTTALGLSNVQPLQVGTAFLNALPPGPALAPPELPDVGKPAGLSGVSAVVGQLLQVSPTQSFVAMSDGVAQVNPLQRALLQSLPLGPGGSVLPAVTVSQSAAFNLPQSTLWPKIASTTLGGLPRQIPQTDPAPADNGGVCARLVAKDELRFTVPGRSLPTQRQGSVSESATSRSGRADKVIVPPGRAAVVRSADGSRTNFLIGDTGVMYPALDATVLGGFGYSTENAVALPGQLLSVIPTGKALVPANARRPVSP